MRTLSIPLVDGVSGTLATVLDVSDLGKAGAGDTEELRGGRVSDGIAMAEVGRGSGVRRDRCRMAIELRRGHPWLCCVV